MINVKENCIFYIFKNKNVFSCFKLEFLIVDAFPENEIQLHEKCSFVPKMSSSLLIMITPALGDLLKLQSMLLFETVGVYSLLKSIVIVGIKITLIFENL